MVEGILGKVSFLDLVLRQADVKVPFRSHAGDDPVSYSFRGVMIADQETMLWDQILLDSWQEIFHDRAVSRLTLEETKMDDTTIDFIDGVSFLMPCISKLIFSY
jgi:hypothetical protein